MKNKITLGFVCVTLALAAISCDPKKPTETAANAADTTKTAVDTLKTAPADTLKK